MKNKLNNNQIEIVKSNKKFIFILAGAGSGKTTTIVYKINFLLSKNTNLNILSITFTNKASKELRSRIKNENVDIETFHSFCYKQIKNVINKNVVSEDIIKNLFLENELLKISNYKNNKTSKKPKILSKYKKYLDDNNLLDFDDMLLIYLEYINKNKILKKEYDYIFVDEFQDTNNIQYEILKKIISPNTSILCVGDPDQSIYAFRGANPSIIDKYINDFDATTYVLNINYRSNMNILEIANKLISHNKNRIKKELISFKKENSLVEYIYYDSYIDEAYNIIFLIKKLLKKYRSQEIAILYRNHYRSIKIKQLLLNSYINIDNNNFINMLTFHQSKGLEFKVVIIIGLESDIIPSIHTKKISEKYEERRLLFVAITRAQDKLYITCSKKNIQNYIVKESSFLKEIK